MKKIILIPAIAGLLFAASANGQYNTNVLTNPSFPSGLDDWFTFGDATIRSDGFSQDNDGGALVIDIVEGTGATGGFYQDHALTSVGWNVGDIVTASGFINTVGWSDSEAWIQIDFKDSGGSTIGSAVEQDGGRIQDVPSYTAVTISSVVIPTSTTTVRFVGISTDLPGTTIDTDYNLFDNLSLSASAVPEPSTYAIIAGFLAFGLVAVRRRMTTK